MFGLGSRFDQRVLRHHGLHACMFCHSTRDHLIVFQTSGWTIVRICITTIDRAVHDYTSYGL